MKSFLHTFLKKSKGYKVETWYKHGQWVDVLCVPESGLRAHNFKLNPVVGFTIYHQWKLFIIDFSELWKL